MKSPTETLLNAIKNQALIKYLTPIADQPFTFLEEQTAKHQRPFELYQYEPNQEIQNTYGDLERKIHEQVRLKFNEYLYEEQEAQLQMQLFALQQTIDIAQNQINFLKLQIQNEKINRSMNCRQLQLALKVQDKGRSISVNKQQIWNKINWKEQKEEVKPFKNSRFKISSSINCQILPEQQIKKQSKIDIQKNRSQNNASLKLNFSQLKKSHRQSHAIYSKRSQTYSSDNQNKQMVKDLKKLDEDNEENIQKKQQKQEIGLKTMQNQIDFYERAWKNAKKQSNKRSAKQYKRKIFQKLQQFWGLKKV